MIISLILCAKYDNKHGRQTKRAKLKEVKTANKRYKITNKNI